LNLATQPHFFTLQNGLKVYTQTHPSIKTLTLHAWVFVGSAHENPGNNGISHFLEHMLFRGNQKLGNSVEMSLAMERLGGEMNAATSFDATEYWLECHKDYFETALKNFALFLRYPSFDQLETERGIVLEEIKNDYNDKNTLIDIDQIAAKALWPNHPMGLSISGTVKTLEKISLLELQDWYKRYYLPKNMILGISGNFDPLAAEAILTAHLGDLDGGQRFSYKPVEEELVPQNQITWVNDPDNQYNLQWSFLLSPLCSRMRLMLQLIGRILDDGSSSRLQRFIREERGLVYDISANHSFFDSGATLSLNATVGKEHLFELMEALTQLITRGLKEGFFAEELELAKLRLQTSLDCYCDSAEGQLHEKVALELYPSYLGLEQIGPVIKGITLEELNDLAGLLLGNDRCALVLIGPAPKDEERLRLETLLKPWLMAP